MLTAMWTVYGSSVEEGAPEARWSLGERLQWLEPEEQWGSDEKQ